MGSDANGNPSFYIARAYGNSGWGLCKPYTYSDSSTSFIPASTIAKLNGSDVYFDDGTEPFVEKENTPYQPAKKAYYETVICGMAYPTGGVWGPGANDSYSIPYCCSSCGSVYGEYSSNGYAYDGPCEPKPHTKRGAYHPATSETAGIRTYNISWKNQLATITLEEIEFNSDSYEEFICSGSLFASDKSDDAIIKIHPDNSVEIEWYGAGIESGHCDKIWTF